MTFFKTLTTLYPFLFITMLLFINSETLLFIAYLWIIFNYLWICNINSILLPDPIELTFSNTLLLSITTTCLCIYSLTTSIFILNIYLYCTYLLGLLFLFIQIYEYQLLYFYISDSFFTSSFYLITGLHFSHVIIGIVLLSFVFTSLYNIKLFYLNIQLFYWHFVEIIWLVLYIVFYSSFIVLCWSGARNQHTPSYLPSYTRLGHAIPGSKTVSVGVCWCIARARGTNTYLHYLH